MTNLFLHFPPFCLSLVRCQHRHSLTSLLTGEPVRYSPSSKREENKMKELTVKIKAGRSPTNYSHRQNRLDLDKI